MNSPKIRIVEVGYDTNVYETGHISGSVGWAWRLFGYLYRWHTRRAEFTSEEYGMTRSIEAVASMRASDANLRPDRLSKELEDFIGDTPPFDDVTFFIPAREEG